MLEDRQWFAAPAANPTALIQLRLAASIDLPNEYFALLAESNGGEGPLPMAPYNLCLDAAEEVIEAIQSGRHADLGGFLIFGGNGGGEYLAFDLRGTGPWPIVSIDMVAGGDSARMVAPDFQTFADLIGREEQA